MKPETLKFTQSHQWISLEGSGRVKTGITDYAQNQLGDIVFVEITRDIGKDIIKGEIFGTIESTKSVIDLFGPVNGKIIHINEQVIDTPEIINSDPYGDGWLIEMEVTGQMDELMNYSEYEEIVKKIQS